MTMGKTSISKAVAIASNKNKPTLTEKKRVLREELDKASKLSASWCRKCSQLLPYEKFTESTNPYLDKNKKMSICTNCTNKMIEEFYQTYNDWERTFFLVCQHIDLLFDRGIVADVKAFVAKGGDKLNTTPFGRYIKILKMAHKTENLRFSNSKLEKEFENSTQKYDEQFTKALKLKWGVYETEEYEYLESKYNEYVKEYGANSPSERDTFTTLCKLLLREQQEPLNKDVTLALKNQFSLIGISPEQLRKENKEKGTKVLGLDILTYEFTEPVEFIEDKKIYFDHDGLQRDMLDLKRATKNHLSGSKDFNSEGVDISEIFIDEEV